MYKILVLMSTYNGEKYLETQLNSIISQKSVESLILVRDDQSSDKTCKILEHYENESNIKWYQGNNIGAAKSFLDLMLNAKNYFDLKYIDYIALADQDDIWKKDKLYIAATALKKNANAALYCCALNTFSETDKAEHHILIPQIYSMVESLIRNSTAGCTMVFTKELLAKLNHYHPSRIIMHDAWIMQICNVLKLQVITDSKPYIHYRLHNNNTCGAAISDKQKIVSHMKRILGDSYTSASIIAHELLAGYQSDISEEYIKMLKLIEQSEKISYRKLKLIILVLKEQFSNIYRKAVFIIEIMIGRV